MNKERYWKIIKIANEQSSGDKKILISKINSLLKHKKDANKFYDITFKLIEDNYLNNERLEKVLNKMSPNGYISDDFFQYIVAGIISRGEEVYNLIMDNPKNIQKIDNNIYNWEFEEFMYIGLDKTGKE